MDIENILKLSFIVRHFIFDWIAAYSILQTLVCREEGNVCNTKQKGIRLPGEVNMELAVIVTSDQLFSDTVSVLSIYWTS